MRWISLPKDLALPHLLDLQAVPQPLADRFHQLGDHLDVGAYDVVLAQAERTFDMAKHTFDRYGQALALLYEAEAFRCLMRWEEGLACIRNALRRLELQVSPVARYNEAIAVYQEGVIHFSLQATERVVETFSYAQHVLDESQRHWGLEENPGRVADCRSAARWMAKLLEVQESLSPGEVVAVLPVYEFVNRVPIRTDVVAIRTTWVGIPGEILVQYLPPTIVPLQLGELPFPYLRPLAPYVAIRIPERGTLWSQGRKGDLLVVEVTGPSSGADELVLTAERPFVRRGDGRVEFQPYAQDASGAPWSSGQGLVGIPRILLREEDSI